jgi:hypothetical protein
VSFSFLRLGSPVFTRNFALALPSSDDRQLGRPTASPVLSLVPDLIAQLEITPSSQNQGTSRARRVKLLLPPPTQPQPTKRPSVSQGRRLSSRDRRPQRKMRSQTVRCAPTASIPSICVSVALRDVPQSDVAVQRCCTTRSLPALDPATRSSPNRYPRQAHFAFPK